MDALMWVAAGTGFTFLCTAIGAASVFVIRGEKGGVAQTLFLGFAAGVMIAASVWSLLIPAIERAEEAGQIGWIPAAGGFALGVAFLMILHAILPHLNAGKDNPEGLPSSWNRSTLLFTAMFMRLPGRKNTFSDSLPGAVLAALGWLIFSGLFSVYMERYAGYSGVYGSVYAVALSMLWLYCCLSIVFYGGALNKLLLEKVDE